MRRSQTIDGLAICMVEFKVISSWALNTTPDVLEWFLEFTESDPPVLEAVLEGVTAENVIDHEVFYL